MARPPSVIVASDGSPSARAAVTLAGAIPWSDDTRAVGVVAIKTVPTTGLGRLYRAVLVKAYRAEARRLEEVLRRRFGVARVESVAMQPVAAILSERLKHGAKTIIVGSRGLGLLGRFPLGSVSRRLVREAPCTVIIAKRSVREVRRLAIAIDGSAASRRAVAFVERLNAPPRGRVVLIGVVPPVPVPLTGRAPGYVRAEVTRHVADTYRRRESALREHLRRASERLSEVGWTVSVDLRGGTPVVEILRSASESRADLLACGARATRGLDRLLLGSVADGLVSRSPMSVLAAK